VINLSEEEKKELSEEELKRLHDIISSIVTKADLCMVKERIETYLRMLGVKFQWSEEDQAFVVPYKIGENIHLIIVRWNGPWLIMSAGILPSESVPSSEKEKLYELILKANHKYPEFSFDMDDVGNIGYSEDIFIPALTFDVFAEEFLSIPSAIKYFWEKIFPLIKGEKPKKTDFIYT